MSSVVWLFVLINDISIRSAAFLGKLADSLPLYCRFHDTTTTALHPSAHMLWVMSRFFLHTWNSVTMFKLNLGFRTFVYFCVSSSLDWSGRIFLWCVLREPHPSRSYC